MHSIVLTSSTVKEHIGCNDVSLHKLELGDSLSVGFPGNNIRIQIAVCFTLAIIDDGIWDCRFTLAMAFVMEFGTRRFTWPSVLSCSGPIVSCIQ